MRSRTELPRSHEGTKQAVFGDLEIWRFRLSCLRVFVATLCVTVGGVASAGGPDVKVSTSLDRTAVWVADRVTYEVTLTCPRGVDILADDLARDKLRLEGLEVVGSESARTTDRNDVTTYRFRYQLTTYRVDLPSLKIAPLAVRYYVKRPGLRLQDAAPAGEVQVPAAVIAFRSMLPDDPASYELRDRRPPAPRRLRHAILQPLGIGLVLISIVPAVLFAAVVSRRRVRRATRSVWQVRYDERASLAAVREIDISTPEGRRDAYTHLNTLVRNHLRDVCGVAAPALTVDEIAPALSVRGRVPAELVTSVLAACDRARYAPPDALPSRDACEAAIEQAEQLLAIR